MKRRRAAAQPPAQPEITPAPKSPDFAQPAPPPSRRNPWPWLSTLLLTVLLLLQIALADRARLAGNAAWRPTLVSLCALFRCSLPPWREHTALHITSREVRPHPSAPGVLLVTATFRNDAAFAQAWPILQLSLANLEGDSLGLRRFSASEYLGSTPDSAWIEPGQSATITLEIVDPGKRAVAFNFEFL